jgi:hypothetical protein
MNIVSLSNKIYNHACPKPEFRLAGTFQERRNKYGKWIYGENPPG